MKENTAVVHTARTHRRRKLQIDRLVLKGIQHLESLGSAWPFWGSLYQRLFYSGMLRQEIALSKISPGMHAVHVGCGPLPMTAIALAGHGVRVTALDQDPRVLDRARKVLERTGFDSQVQLMSACGTGLDYSNANAVWISLHVRPLENVLQRAMDTVPAGASIIFRDPRGPLCRYYAAGDPGLDPAGFSCIRQNQILGKKSVVMTKKLDQRLAWEKENPSKPQRGT
ncbi:hypothetical protein [Desulfonatronospira sp.]|uniref:class I SAM-dependent methyltransferase n=1 Tax=Desulfonatronospira sp. TaxID=1962951 RepID=UPI0025BAEFB4|nr:hypothetical protein [Desulfonatronospira sp.]